jgi:hypothetical protein
MRNLPAILSRGLFGLLLSTIGAVPALASHAFEVTIVPPEPGAPNFQLYRIDTATGQAWMIVSGQFVATADPQPLPQGDYHLHYAETADGKTYWVYRLDSGTGRMWIYSANKWNPIGEPK